MLDVKDIARVAGGSTRIVSMTSLWGKVVRNLSALPADEKFKRFRASFPARM